MTRFINSHSHANYDRVEELNKSVALGEEELESLWFDMINIESSVFGEKPKVRKSISIERDKGGE